MGRKNREKINDYIRVLADTLSSAKIHFEIGWRFSKNLKALMHRHGDFIIYSRDAHLSLAFLSLTKLFETGSNDYNISFEKLLNYVSSNRSKFPAVNNIDIKNDLAELKNLRHKIKNLKELRDKRIVHNDKRKLKNDSGINYKAINEAIKFSDNLIEKYSILITGSSIIDKTLLGPINEALNNYVN